MQRGSMSRAIEVISLEDSISRYRVSIIHQVQCRIVRAERGTRTNGRTEGEGGRVRVCCNRIVRGFRVAAARRTDGANRYVIRGINDVYYGDLHKARDRWQIRGSRTRARAMQVHRCSILYERVDCAGS